MLCVRARIGSIRYSCTCKSYRAYRSPSQAACLSCFDSCCRRAKKHEGRIRGSQPAPTAALVTHTCDAGCFQQPGLHRELIPLMRVALATAAGSSFLGLAQLSTTPESASCRSSAASCSSMATLCARSSAERAPPARPSIRPADGLGGETGVAARRGPA